MYHTCRPTNRWPEEDPSRLDRENWSHLPTRELEWTEEAKAARLENPYANPLTAEESEAWECTPENDDEIPF